MLMEKGLPLALDALLAQALGAVPAGRRQGPRRQLTDFIYDRLRGLLREQGYSAQEVEAVLALQPQRLGNIVKRLAAVRAFAALPEAPALAAANKRIANILKKAERRRRARAAKRCCRKTPRRRCTPRCSTSRPRAGAQFEAGDYTGSLQTLAALRGAGRRLLQRRDGECRGGRPAPQPPGPAGRRCTAR